MTQTCILYSRFSSHEQAQGHSIERQQTNGRQYIEAQGWTLESVISDEALSAFKGTNREEGAQLHKFELDARNGLHRDKVLVVENIDRLSRQGAKAAAQLVWSLNENGVDVATWHDGYIYKADGSGDLMELFSVIIKAQMAFEESLKKSKHGHAVWANRFDHIAAGDKTVKLTAAPFWLTYTEAGYVADEHRANVINEIFDWYLKGDGILAIVQRLNERNEPVWSNAAAGWHLAYISRVLKSRQVLGEVTNSDGLVISTDHFPQIIDADRFQKVQQLIASKSHTGGRDARTIHNLLGGIMRCAVCEQAAGYTGKGVSQVKYVARSGETRVYEREKYARVCCNSHRRRSGCDNKTSIRYKVIESFVLDNMMDFVAADPEIARTTDTKLVALSQQKAELQRNIDALQAKLDHLVEVIADGGSKALVQKTVDLEREIESLNQQMVVVANQLEIEASKPTAIDDVELVNSLRADIDSVDADVRFYTRTKIKAALARLLPAIFVNDDDTFTVWASEYAVWTCDKQGQVVSGQFA